MFFMMMFALTSLNAIDFYDDFAQQHKYIGFNHELENKKYLSSKDKIYYFIFKTPLTYSKERKGEKIFFMNSRTKESWRIDVSLSYKIHMTYDLVNNECKRTATELATLYDMRNMDKNLIDFSIKTLGIDKKEAVFWIRKEGKAYSFYEDKLISTKHIIDKQAGKKHPKKNRYLYICKISGKKYYYGNMKAYKETFDKYHRVEKLRARDERIRKIE